MLLFIDNIFRFTQAGSEVSALLGRMPSAVGYQPTLGTEMGAAPGADHLDQEGLDHLGAGDLRAGRRHHRPGAGHGLRPPRRHHRARRGRSPSSGIYPAVDPLASTSRILDPNILGAGALPAPRARCSRSCSATRICRTSSPSSAWKSSPTRTSSRCRARGRSSASCPSRSSWPRSSPASPARYVKLADTVKGFKEVVEGKHDDLPEQAFYMVGDIDEAVEKAKKLREVALSGRPAHARARHADAAGGLRGGRRGGGARAARATSACCPATRRFSPRSASAS